MGKIIIFIISMFLIGCIKQYKYKIIGSVIINDTLKKAIWYTDTISFKLDTAYYVNSDGSEVNINNPHKIYKIY
jgi:hypothetical protein